MTTDRLSERSHVDRSTPNFRRVILDTIPTFSPFQNIHIIFLPPPRQLFSFFTHFCSNRALAPSILYAYPSPLRAFMAYHVPTTLGTQFFDLWPRPDLRQARPPLAPIWRGALGSRDRLTSKSGKVPNMDAKRHESTREGFAVETGPGRIFRSERAITAIARWSYYRSKQRRRARRER